LVFKVNVETADIDEGKLEILRRGVIDVGDQTPRIRLLRGPVKTLEIALDATMPVPPHDVRGNFISDGITEHCRMFGTLVDAVADSPSDPACPATLIEECEMLLPREPYHYEQAVTMHDVGQPARVDGLGAQA